MKREFDLKEDTDGKFYELRDMVKAGCRDCEGCSACCHDMEALWLDPLDIYRMTRGLDKTFSELLQRELRLEVCDGMILPRLHMQDSACPFLNEAGRCSIHAFRPGICRLYPLARLYENGDFRYVLQVHECGRPNRYKVRVSDWLGESEPEKNRLFLNVWHDFRMQAEEIIASLAPEKQTEVLTCILQIFYMLPYEDRSFYPQFASRMTQARQTLGI